MSELNPIIEIPLMILIIILIYAVWVWVRTRKAKNPEVFRSNPFDEVRDSSEKPPVKELLEGAKGKQCELVTRRPMAAYGYEMNIKGTVVDVDSDWVLLSTSKRKGELVRVLRIAQFKDVREIDTRKD